MNSLWQAPVVVVALITWLNATPTSFADAAQREALRRQLTPKPTRQLTNLNLPPSAILPIPDATPTPASGTGASSDDSSASAQAAKPATPADDAKHDEQWWRDRVAAARKTLEDDQNLATALQNRISSLTADFTSRMIPRSGQRSPTTAARRWTSSIGCRSRSGRTRRRSTPCKTTRARRAFRPAGCDKREVRS